MRTLVGSAALAILCSACVAAPPPAPPPPLASAVTDFQTKVAADDPNCREYTGQATISGAPQQVVGRACRQADGSWRVAEGTPENPSQYVAVYPAPVYYPGYYYADYWPYDPWFWDASFGFGGGFVFFDHHFHHRGFHGGHFGHAMMGGGGHHRG
jgi:hypothetical protein